MLCDTGYTERTWVTVSPRKSYCDVLLTLPRVLSHLTASLDATARSLDNVDVKADVRRFPVEGVLGGRLCR